MLRRQKELLCLSFPSSNQFLTKIPVNSSVTSRGIELPQTTDARLSRYTKISPLNTCLMSAVFRIQRLLLHISNRFPSEPLQILCKSKTLSFNNPDVILTFILNYTISSIISDLNHENSELCHDHSDLS